MMRFILLLLSLFTLIHAQQQSAKIVSCSGWALNRLRELKSFLLDGEAEEYQGVEVEYVQGRKATMYIYDSSGEEVEQITLSDYETKEDMHRMMQQKGFPKKSPEEIRALQQTRQEKRQEKLEAKKAAAGGVGVDNVINPGIEEIPEEKAAIWQAELKVAEDELKKGNTKWKEAAMQAGVEESKKLDGEKERRRKLAMQQSDL